MTTTTEQPTTAHPDWCDPAHSSADPQAPADLSHASATMSTGRGWNRINGDWNAVAQIMAMDWNDGDAVHPFAVIRFNDSEDVLLFESDIVQLVGFLDSVRGRLVEALRS